MLKNSKSLTNNNSINGFNKRYNEWNYGKKFKKSIIKNENNPIIQKEINFIPINKIRRINNNHLTTFETKEQIKEFKNKKKSQIKKNDLKIWKPSVKQINYEINKKDDFNLNIGKRIIKSQQKQRNPILNEKEIIKNIKIKVDCKPSIIYNYFSFKKENYISRKKQNNIKSINNEIVVKDLIKYNKKRNNSSNVQNIIKNNNYAKNINTNIEIKNSLNLKNRHNNGIKKSDFYNKDIFKNNLRKY